MQKGHPSFLCWMLMEGGGMGRMIITAGCRCDSEGINGFWLSIGMHFSGWFFFFSFYCSTQNDPLGAIPNPAEDCHQFSRLSMTLSKLLYSLQQNVGSKNTFWHFGEVMSISSHTRMQLLETVCPFRFSKTNLFPECNKKRLRLSSNSAY